MKARKSNKALFIDAAKYFLLFRRAIEQLHRMFRTDDLYEICDAVLKNHRQDCQKSTPYSVRPSVKKFTHAVLYVSRSIREVFDSVTSLAHSQRPYRLRSSMRIKIVFCCSSEHVDLFFSRPASVGRQVSV